MLGRQHIWEDFPVARPKFPTLALAVALAFSNTSVQAGPLALTVPASSSSGVGAFGLIGCVSSIILAAVDAGRKFNRELTAQEAATCGLLYWINLANTQR